VRQRVASPLATSLKHSEKQSGSLHTRAPHSHSQATSAGPARGRLQFWHAMVTGFSAAMRDGSSR
jgi:hypothetical protein